MLLRGERCAEVKTLYLERSTGDCRDGGWAEEINLDGVERIVVGLGPGSFAGIRSALAFAQGAALGCGCVVFGLPSPCAIAAKTPVKNLAVVGDARRGKFWVAIFEDMKLRGGVFQVERAALADAVGAGRSVVSPDDARIGAELRGIFADRYLGLRDGDGEGLEIYAEANAEELVAEPLPIYLNPAVRAD